MTIRGYLQGANLARFPFVFVVTFGRSGSTLLQGLLNGIDGYCIRGENDGALFHLYKAIAGLHRVRGVWGGATEPRHPMYGAHLYEPDKIEAAWLDIFFEQVLNTPPATRCCGFKEIRHTMNDMSDADFHAYLDFVERAFPGAAFILNIRSIEATGKSNWWAGMAGAEKYGILVNAHHRLRNQAQHRKNSFLFSYDAWLDDPDYARHLFVFLGEPYDAALVREVLAKKHSF